MAISKPKVTEKMTKPAMPDIPDSLEDSSVEVAQEEETASNETGTTVSTDVKPTGISTHVAPSDDGFGDLDDQIGFGSFPIVKLDKDKFIVGDASLDQIDCIIMSVRKKYLFKVKQGSGDNEQESICYSYDGIHDTSGNPLSSVFEEWKEEGFESDPSRSDYMEAVAQLADEAAGELNGQLVLLSVPPASVKRLAGYRAQLKVVYRQKPQQVITRCMKAPLVKITPKISFYPWDFKKVGNAPEA